ncbi:MAG: alpha-1,2-fucosyltransferase [Olsenella sp.]|nr:alpha-1,2-fucosyltransferase [Olsenella sp.]
MKEIHTLLTGRLGNQLFQYAFARNLQKQYGGQIYCDVYELEHRMSKVADEKFSYAMGGFKLDANVIREDKAFPWYADFSNLVIKPVKKVMPRKYFESMAKRGYLMWQRSDYMPIPVLDAERIFASGWWQDIRYLQDVQKELSDEIVPITRPLMENKYVYDVARDKESVCISIRCGNYFNPTVKKLLYVCNPQYFHDSIERISQMLNHPKFIVFTDDVKWVKEHLKFEDAYPQYEFLYERGCDTVEEKIRMMTMCNNFIISNSTFSWWAQFLSKNDNKIVIAPDKWFVDGRKIGLYMDSWTLVPAGC